MSQDAFQCVVEFFDRLGQSAAAQEELACYDQTIQFHIDGAEPFFVRIEAGKIAAAVGAVADTIATINDFLRWNLKRGNVMSPEQDCFEGLPAFHWSKIY
jgi:hypothetical protein